jgi:hypothetical protein
MKTVQKLKILIGFYLGALAFLLLLVITIPLVIQHGLSVTRGFIIEEEILEAILIIFLFLVSFFILRGFKHTLKAYEHIVNRVGEERSRLVSRLSEAINYIGTVNVELQEIQSILYGVEHYPQTKREFKQFIDNLAAKAMTIAGTPWIVIRMISRCSGRTVKEYAIVRRNGKLPSTILGNREILENRHPDGLISIGTRQKNLDLLTVCLLPTIQISEEEKILITAIANQVEMFFILYRAGFLHQQSFNCSKTTTRSSEASSAIETDANQK